MLSIKVPVGVDGWDEINNVFVDAETKVLELEHSLVSVSKWESKWHKSFISGKEKTAEETVDYIKCMVLGDVDPEIFDHLTPENVKEINEYIGAPMTATVFNSRQENDKSKDVVTSELIYYWMIAQQIPFECQYWHLNRLLTLIRVCNVKNAAPSNRSKSDIMRSNAAINKANRARFNSKG